MAQQGGDIPEIVFKIAFRIVAPSCDHRIHALSDDIVRNTEVIRQRGLRLPQKIRNERDKHRIVLRRFYRGAVSAEVGAQDVVQPYQRDIPGQYQEDVLLLCSQGVFAYPSGEVRARQGFPPLSGGIQYVVPGEPGIFSAGLFHCPNKGFVVRGPAEHFSDALDGVQGFFAFYGGHNAYFSR